MFKQYDRSVLQKPLNDENARILPTGRLSDWSDITQLLQKQIDDLKKEDRAGVLLIPSGKYTVSGTVYIPRAIKLVGYGEKRPVIKLRDYCAGYEGSSSSPKYLFHFTNNVPSVDGKVADSNPATFYSGLMNLSVSLGKGNGSACAVRSHYAQNCNISYCDFDIDSGLCAVFEAGNIVDHCSFTGGSCAVISGKSSPGWPIAFTDCSFSGQSRCAFLTHESGMTVLSCEFSDIPMVMDTVENRWEKAYFEDCRFVNVSTAVTFRFDNSTCSQLNMRNIYCENVTMVYHGVQKDEIIAFDSREFVIKKLTGGLCERNRKKAAFKSKMTAFAVDAEPEMPACLPELPSQGKWVSVASTGAVGDGVTDDTDAICRAVELHECVYFPQGRYRVTRPIVLRRNTKLISVQPASTIIFIRDDSPEFSGFGSPRGVIEARGGNDVFIVGLTVDTAGRNQRASGIIWECGGCSFMYDVKFAGGHGKMTAATEFAHPYNESRTADYNKDYVWDSQYPSLIVRGGGTLANVWSASPYAEAGLLVENTEQEGKIVQLSVEHHVRNEIILKNIKNWSFLAVQTEEEKAESAECVPFEISGCDRLTFANLYAFRVIWLENAEKNLMKISGCGKINIYNLHNYTQMKYTAERIYSDAERGKGSGEWQLARLKYRGKKRKVNPAGRYSVRRVAGGFEDACSICSDSKGTVYFADGIAKKIYSIADGRVTLLHSLHYRPISVVCDEDDNLCAVMEYGLLPGEEAAQPFSPAERKAGRSSYYDYFSVNKRVKACVFTDGGIKEIRPVPFKEEKYSVLFMPQSVWCDAGLANKTLTKPNSCFPLPDGISAIAFTPAVSRTVQLERLLPNGSGVLADEYNKCLFTYNVSEAFEPYNVVYSGWRGERSAVVANDGRVFVCDNALHIYERDGREVTRRLNERPEALLLLGNLLYITARRKVYVMNIGPEGKK